MRAVQQAVPHLVKLFSIGSSFEGRHLLLAEVTNRGTREGLEKPAIWIDGNSRAAEVASSHACLEVLRQLASDHGRDEVITELLDSCTFYIAPRLAPDGAERCLTTGELVCSGVRPYPYEDAVAGLIPGDVDGDGWIRQMRIPDPLGEWKPSKRDPRLLVRRRPDDRQGPFFRLYREGFVDGVRARPIRLPKGRYSLDFNRNYPRGWAPEIEVSGPFPLSENEPRAVADFFRTHPNLFGAVSCRTQGGFLSQPRLSGAPASDRRLFERLVERLGEVSGLAVLDEVAEPAGSFLDWAYDSMGLLAFSPYLWSLGKAAGLEVNDPLALNTERGEIECVSVLRWLEREGLDGKGFAQWKPFEHPQFGTVELGGWDLLNTWYNPPPGRLLKDEIQRFVKLVISLASAGPRLVCGKVIDEVVGYSEARAQVEPETLRRIRVQLENRGYLSSWVTQRALDDGYAFPAEVDVVCEEGTSLMIGQGRQTLGQFSGTGSPHFEQRTDSVVGSGSEERQRMGLEWLVKGDGEVKFEVRHDRAGFVKFSSRSTKEKGVPAAPPAPPTRKTSTLPSPPGVFPTVPAASAEPPRPFAPAGSTTAPGLTTPQGTPSPAAHFGGPAGPPAPAPAPQPAAQAPASAAGQASPFPKQSPTSGRVFGSPPPKKKSAGLTPTLAPRSLPTAEPEPPNPAAALVAQQQAPAPEEPVFSPLPLGKEADFTPTRPPQAAPPPRRPQMPTAAPPGSRPPQARPAEPPPMAAPPEQQDFPQAPPPRVSRIPAPLLLRRQRPGGTKER